MWISKHRGVPLEEEVLVDHWPIPWEKVHEKIAYLHRNPIAAGFKQVPYFYRWSSASLLFSGRPDILDSMTKASQLSAAKKERIFYSRVEIPDNWLIDKDGMVWPGCFVDIRLAEKQFQSVGSYMFDMNNGNIDKECSLAERISLATMLKKEMGLSLPQARGNLSLASSVEGMNDALSCKYQSEISLDTVALFVDSLLSIAHINRDVTIQEIDATKKVIRQNNNRSTSWSLLTKPVSIRRNQSKAIRLALNNPYPELAQKLSPLFLISAIILGFFAIIIFQLLRFITEQEQIAELRNDFSYAMVHDMKSPLSSIIMGAHFLHSGKVDDKPQIKEKYYSIIDDEAEHLLTLVNKLLTISKLENKKLILNKWDINLEPIIDDLIEKTKPKTTKPLKVTTDLKTKNILADEQYIKYPAISAP